MQGTSFLPPDRRASLSAERFTTLCAYRSTGTLRAAKSLRGDLVGMFGMLFSLLCVGCLLVAPAHAQVSPANSPSVLKDESRNASPKVLESTEKTHARKLFVRGMTRAFVEDHESAIVYYEQALGLTPDEAPILAALAESKRAQGDVTSALYYAREARRVAPGNPSYHELLATMQQSNGRYEAAIESYKRLLDTHPHRLDALIGLAESQARANRPKAAAETYEMVIERGLDQPQIYLDLLPLYRELEDKAGIETSLEALLEYRPSNRAYTQHLGRLYIEQGRTAEAIQIFEQLLERKPGSVDFVMQLSALYREAGQSTRADSLVQEFVAAADATPDQLVGQAKASLERSGVATQSPGAFLRLSREAHVVSTTPPALLPNAEDDVPAEQLLRRALEQEPRHLDALTWLGRIEYFQRNYEAAVPLFRTAIEEDPRSSKRWTFATAALLLSGEKEAAAETVDEALLLFPGHPPLLRLAAYASASQGQNDDAIRQLQAALKRIDRDDVAPRSRLYTELGLIMDRAGAFSDAADAFSAALRLDPANTDAASIFAYRLAERENDLDRALDLAQQAVQSDASNAAYQATLGWVYFKQNRFSDAQLALQRAIDTGHASATAYEHMGDVNRALGDMATARSFWKQALERDPERTRVQEKLNALSG